MTELRWEAENAVVRPPSAIMTNSASNGKSIKTEVVKSDDFPAGLRVLVVDDDPVYLLLLDRMLRQCRYLATTRSNALSALELLRENRDKFDLVISDVHMPDMDGFKLLELVGLEMDLPVIMMSANGETSTVMKGINHGACDYMLKPVRLEELRNIWQHVVRKKKKVPEQICSNEEGRHSQLVDDGNSNTFSANFKKRKSANNKEEEDEEDDDGDQDNVEPSSKRPRVVWSMDLHQQFVNAVNQLGIDKAVPKRILELMNVQGLSRENVASHLQKYRLYLKRINVNHRGGVPMVAGSSFIGVSDSNMGIVMAGGRAGLGEILHNPLVDARLSQQPSISPFQGGLLASNHGSLMKSLFVLPTRSNSISRVSSDLNALVQGRFLSQGSTNSQCSFATSAMGLDNNSNLSGSSNNDALLLQMLHRQANAWTRGNSGISGFTSNCISRPSALLSDVENSGILSINEEVGSRHLSPLVVSNSGPLLDCFGKVNDNWPTGCRIDMSSVGEEALVGESFLSDVYESIPQMGSADGRGSYKPSFFSTSCHNGQWTEQKGKKESVDVSASQLGNPHVSLVEPFQPSDDFLNVILNQQHGGMGFTDNDLAIDGFRPNDTYVV